MGFLKNLFRYKSLVDIKDLSTNSKIQWGIIIFLKLWFDSFIFTAGFFFLILYNSFYPIQNDSPGAEFNFIAQITFIGACFVFLIQYKFLRKAQKSDLGKQIQEKLEKLKKEGKITEAAETIASSIKNAIRQQITVLQKEDPQKAKEISEMLRSLEKYQQEREIVIQQGEGEITLPVLVEYLGEKKMIQVKFPWQEDTPDPVIAKAILSKFFADLVISAEIKNTEEPESKKEEVN